MPKSVMATDFEGVPMDSEPTQDATPNVPAQKRPWRSRTLEEKRLLARKRSQNRRIRERRKRLQIYPGTTHDKGIVSSDDSSEPEPPARRCLEEALQEMQDPWRPEQDGRNSPYSPITQIYPTSVIYFQAQKDKSTRTTP